MEIAEKLEELLHNQGVYDFGSALLTDGVEGLPYALSIVIPLSDAILDEIGDAPTHTYFNHYRAVNALIDQILLKVGLLLQKEGYRYIPIAASQSIPDGTNRTHQGRYSHKKAAVLAGLGTIGKSSLFIHHHYGPRVRLGTLFTDCPLPTKEMVAVSACIGCDLCVKSCPAGAIKGVFWHQGVEREELFDADACNSYMREHFMQIGRGSTCGICVKVCKQRGNAK